jgi:hypothetical protein
LIRALLDNPLYFFAAMATTLLVASEAGILANRLWDPEAEPSVRSHNTTIQGAVFAILGLLLGFTFAMALGRFDTRKQLVLQEADAIGTTYLRSDILPPMARQSFVHLLRSYVAARLDFASSAEPSHVQRTLAEAADLQEQIWGQAFEAVRGNNTPLTSLLIQSLNQMFDLEADRTDVLRNRIPGSIWLLLGAVSAFGCIVTGYLYPRPVSFTTLALPLVLAAVMALIVDLDSPRAGLIRISQASMQDVEKTIDEASILRAPHPLGIGNPAP